MKIFLRPLDSNNLWLQCFTALVLLAVSLFPFHHASSQENTDATFLLNLKNVDIRSLIETVSKRTGKNFIIDPRVKATVTMISSAPIDQEELYEIFLSVLNVHGYAAVAAGEVIKIVPVSVGVQSAIPLLGESGNAHDSTTTDELVSRVIVLTNTSATQMVETLRPLLPQTAIFGAESNSNSIVVTDRATNIEKVVELIHSLDNR